MNITEILVLALIQGLTEFLPISSSAHLIIPAILFGWDAEKLFFFLAVHAGSLIAVLWYFWRELWTLIRGCRTAISDRTYNHELDLSLKLAFASVPVLGIGYFASTYVESVLYNLPIIATTTIGFALLLAWADYRRSRKKQDVAQNFSSVHFVEHINVTWRQSAAIGISQVLAIVPGTSRSGVAITFGLFLGLSRTIASRFALLLAIPIISLSFFYSVYVEFQSAVAIDWSATTIGFVVSAISAFVCIRLFLKFVERIGMMPFVVYRLALGVVILALI